MSIFDGYLWERFKYLDHEIKFNNDITLLEPGMPLSRYFKDGHDELNPGHIHIIVQGSDPSAYKSLIQQLMDK